MGYWREMRSTTFPTHVKGHQDDNIDASELPRLARMNTRIDEIAKRILQNSLHQSEPLPKASFKLRMVKVKQIDVYIHSSLETSLRKACKKGPLLEYWRNHSSIPELSFKHINWTVFSKARTSAGLAR